MHADAAWSEFQDEGEYDLVNLTPRSTGLPMVVFASYRKGAKHDAQLTVSQVHGARMDSDNVAVVGIRPSPRVLHGALPKSDLELVTRWIELNHQALIDFWEERLDGAEFALALKPL